MRAKQNCITQYYCPFLTYLFTYNNDAIPHLNGIANWIGTGESYNFTYNSNQNLTSPFNGQSFGTTTGLATVGNNAGAQHSFIYNGGMEMTKATFPYGGYLRWDYVSTPMLGRTMREVRYRSWATAAGQPEKTYTIYHDGNASLNIHYYSVVQDAGGTAVLFLQRSRSGGRFHQEWCLHGWQHQLHNQLRRPVLNHYRQLNHVDDLQQFPRPDP